VFKERKGAKLSILISILIIKAEFKIRSLKVLIWMLKGYLGKVKRFLQS